MSVGTVLRVDHGVLSIVRHGVDISKHSISRLYTGKDEGWNTPLFS